MTSTRLAVLYLIGGLAGGFALSALLRDGDSIQLQRPNDDAGALELQLAAMQRRLDDVQSDNQSLAAQLEQLGDTVAQLQVSAALPSDERADADRSAQGTAQPNDAGARPPEAFIGNLQDARRRRIEGLESRLTDAGFGEADAQHIRTRLEELRVEAMQARYEAQVSGEPTNLQLFSPDAALREELGDIQYERYLEATGRPTRVNVASVLASSSADSVGIRAGDEIVSYGGERVFDVRELNQALLAGEPGEPVLVDIMRDGQPMQVVMPRGPLGIVGGRPGRRGP